MSFYRVSGIIRLRFYLIELRGLAPPVHVEKNVEKNLEKNVETAFWEFQNASTGW